MVKFIIEVIILRKEHEGGFFVSENPVIGMKIASVEEMSATGIILMCPGR